MTRRCFSRPSRQVIRRRLLGYGLLLAIALISLASAEAAPADDRLPRASPPPLVQFDAGRVSVDVRDTDLATVLQEIADRADFALETTGLLGRVTATFADAALEDALRRLVQQHELMLIYGPAADARTGARLVDVHVFAASSTSAASGTVNALGEINQLARSGNDPATVARLADLLSFSNDPTVRARAAWALGTIGASPGAVALMRAVRDEAPQVRAQVVYALRRIHGVEATPTFVHLLLHDSDASVRRAAAGALSAIRDPSATSALSAATADPDPAVRNLATRALQRAGVAVP